MDVFFSSAVVSSSFLLKEPKENWSSEAKNSITFAFPPQNTHRHTFWKSCAPLHTQVFHSSWGGGFKTQEKSFNTKRPEQFQKLDFSSWNTNWSSAGTPVLQSPYSLSWKIWRTECCFPVSQKLRVCPQKEPQPDPELSGFKFNFSESMVSTTCALIDSAFFHQFLSLLGIQGCQAVTHLTSISAILCWLSSTSSLVTSYRGMSDRYMFFSSISVRLDRRGEPMKIMCSTSFNQIIWPENNRKPRSRQNEGRVDRVFGRMHHLLAVSLS